MAKDGTARGGARPNSGPSKKSKRLKIIEGKEVRSIPDSPKDFDDKDFDALSFPKIEAYLLDEQKETIGLEAEPIYKKTYLYLDSVGCKDEVPQQLVTNYALLTARAIQCERLVSKNGLLGTHPTTGLATTSPYASQARDYMKQSNMAWYQIQQIVSSFSEGARKSEMEDAMEELLGC